MAWGRLHNNGWLPKLLSHNKLMDSSHFELNFQVPIIIYQIWCISNKELHFSFNGTTDLIYLHKICNDLVPKKTWNLKAKQFIQIKGWDQNTSIHLDTK